MNPIDNETTAGTPPVAFCQNCGKPLTVDTVRKVGPAVYCEPCLEARLTGNPGPIPNYGPAGTVPPPYSNVRYTAGPNGVPIASPSIPNPGLAALLGLIPGVGAMYNEQYAKGIVHLAIFAVLITFSHVSDIFGLFAFGWICYMSIEAHHTAKARRDGTPLPNPFGFNDIGERMGFAKTWPTTHAEAAATAQAAANAAAETARDAAAAAAAGVHAATASFNRPPVPPTPEPNWGAPTDQYAASYPSPQPPAYTPVETSSYAQTYSQPYRQPYAPNYTDTAAPLPVMPATPRFPIGAILLITLGLIFLLGTLGLFSAVPGSALVGVGLLFLGVFVFFRRMTDTGQSLAYDGTPAYHLRVLRALRGSIWLVAIGILALLSSLHVANLRYTWPWLVILFGVMMLLERAAANSAASAYPFPGAPSATASPFEVGTTKPTTPAGNDTTPGAL